MAKKKEPAETKEFKKLKQDLAAGTPPGSVYIFYGEETFLRDRYLQALRTALIPAGMEAFNYHAVEGEDLNARLLAELAEALPVMAERTMIVVKDYDLFKAGEEERKGLIAFFSDVPDYCCVVFVYDTIPPYKPNKTMKKLCKALECAQAVEFRPAETKDLIDWISRHFKAEGKRIDRATAEYLIFTCGNLMTGLLQQINKIAAYAKGPAITKEDIDAMADPVLLAEVFRMAEAAAQGNADRAASILGDLLKMQTEPIPILAALGSQLRRLRTARIALDTGRDARWLMDIWGMKSDYPARMLLNAARRVSPAWCAEAVKRCQALDLRMKSQRGADAAGELKLLLAQLEATR